MSHTFEVVDVENTIHPAAAGTGVGDPLQQLHKTGIGGASGLHPHQQGPLAIRPCVVHLQACKLLIARCGEGGGGSRGGLGGNGEVGGRGWGSEGSREVWGEVKGWLGSTPTNRDPLPLGHVSSDCRQIGFSVGGGGGGERGQGPGV